MWFLNVMSSSLFEDAPGPGIPQKRAGVVRGQPKHLLITQAIEQEIASGVLPPGGQLPTEAQLMERFAVSRITVRRALQGLTQDGTLVARQGSGTFVNPSLMASVHPILFVHATESDISYPYTALILEGARRIADAPPRALRIQLAAMPPIQQQAPGDTTIEEQVEFGRCRGVISLARLHPAAMQRLTERGIPVAMIGGRHFITPPEGVVVVSVNVSDIFESALRYLMKAGRQRIAILRGDTPDSSIAERYLNKLTARLKISIPPGQWEVASGWGANAGARAMERLLDRCPDIDGVIAADDLMALGALHTLWGRGLKVPEQVALIGIGNQLGEHSHCGISTVDIQLRQQGELAAHSILQRLRGQPVNPMQTVEPFLLHRSTS